MVLYDRGDSDVSRYSIEELAEAAVEGMRTCVNCETTAEAIDRIDEEHTPDGPAVVAIFDCRACGWHNRNSTSVVRR